MKKLLISALAFTALLITSCAPTADQLKKVIEANPDVVFVAIEKDPDKFIEVVNKAARSAQEKQQQGAAEEEKKKRDEEFANPIKPVIEDGRVIFGNKNAPITIVEYSDFECPYCARGYATVKQVMQEYGDKVRIVFKHLPLDFHPKAMPAAKMFEAIALQDHAKAEKFHDMIFEDPQGFKSDDFMKNAAKKLGLDFKKIEADMKSDKVTERVKADMEEARKYGFSGTPGFLINGVSLRGAYPFESFKEIIDRHLASAK